jgi:hypothetical protein
MALILTVILCMTSGTSPTLTHFGMPYSFTKQIKSLDAKPENQQNVVNGQLISPGA